MSSNAKQQDREVLRQIADLLCLVPNPPDSRNRTHRPKERKLQELGFRDSILVRPRSTLIKPVGQKADQVKDHENGECDLDKAIL